MTIEKVNDFFALKYIPELNAVELAENEELRLYAVLVASDEKIPFERAVPAPGVMTYLGFKENPFPGQPIAYGKLMNDSKLFGYSFEVGSDVIRNGAPLRFILEFPIELGKPWARPSDFGPRAKVIARLASCDSEDPNLRFLRFVTPASEVSFDTSEDSRSARQAASPAESQTQAAQVATKDREHQIRHDIREIKEETDGSVFSLTDALGIVESYAKDRDIDSVRIAAFSRKFDERELLARYGAPDESAERIIRSWIPDALVSGSAQGRLLRYGDLSIVVTQDGKVCGIGQHLTKTEAAGINVINIRPVE